MGFMKNNKFINFLKDNFYYFIPPIAILITFTIIYAFMGYFPFGKGSIASYDLNNVCALAEHFFDVLEGKASLFYTHRLSGGMDLYGSNAFTFISPFTVVFLLFGKGNAVLAVNIVLVLKLMATATTMHVCLKKIYQNLGPVELIILSLAYALCGYTVSSSTYIIWLDLTIYLPILALGVKTIHKTGRMPLFIVGVTGMIYTSFSIGTFMLLLVAVCVVAYGIMVVEKEQRKKCLSLYAIGFALSFTLALPVMVPSLISVLNSARISDQSLIQTILNRDIKTSVDTKITFVVSDVVNLLLAVLFIVFCDKSDKGNKFLFFTLLITGTLIVCDNVMVALNLGPYFGYAYRLGLPFTFALALVAGKIVSEEQAKKEDFEIEKKTSVLANVVLYSFAVINAAFAGVNLLLQYKEGNVGWITAFAHGYDVLDMLIPALITGIPLIVAALFLRHKKMIKFRFLSLAFVPILFVQFITNSLAVSAGNYFDTNVYDNVNSLTSVIDDKEKPFTRIKDVDALHHNDFHYFCDMNAFVVFSSLVSEENFTAPVYLGYSSNNQNSLRSDGGTVFSDCLLGYKYFITTKPYDKEYLEFMNKTAYVYGSDENPYFESGNKKPKATETYLYENKWVFPNAYGVSSSDLNFDKNVSSTMNKLYNFVGGEGEIFKGLELTSGKQADGSYAVYFSGKPTQSVAFVEILNKDVKVYYKGGDGIYYLIDERVTTPYSGIVLKADGDVLDASTISQYIAVSYETVTDFSELSNKLWEKAIDLKYTKNGFKFNYNGGEPFVFINSVALDGYTVKVNGKTVKMVENDFDLIVIPMQDGENKVEITYKSPYLKLALILTAVAIFIGVALIFGLKKYDCFFGKFDGVISVAFIIVGGIIFLIFLLFPTIAGVMNLIL